MRLLLLSALSACTGAPDVPQPAERPNVVLVLVDDLGAFDIGCYGNPAVNTPRIDRFSREAVRFANVLSDLEHVGRKGFIGQAPQFSNGIPIAKGGAVFDRQLVQGKMIDGHGQRQGQFLFPICQGLILSCVDQIKTDPLKGLVRDIKGCASVGNCMDAAQSFQIQIVQGLNTH